MSENGAKILGIVGIILLVAAAFELCSPIDFIPDFIPYVGWADDIILGGLGGIAGIVSFIVSRVSANNSRVENVQEYSEFREYEG